MQCNGTRIIFSERTSEKDEDKDKDGDKNKDKDKDKDKDKVPLHHVPQYIVQIICMLLFLLCLCALGKGTIVQ